MRDEFRAALPEAARRFGTPLYAYSWDAVAERRAALAAAFGEARTFYAIKANPNLGLLRRLRGLGLGFEAVSGGELERAVLAGADGDEIVLNGPGKLEADLARAGELGAVVVLDGPSEARRLARVAPRARVLVRVNPGLKVSTHDHLATGDAASKFGFRLADVPRAVEAAEAAGLAVLGLHVHIGSSITDPADYGAALERVAGLRAALGPRSVLDAGGGFGLGLELPGLAALAFEAARAYGAKLWLEPGRWLVAEAGVLLTRVLERKATARPYAVGDAGMTELLRPMLYGATHPVLALGREGPLAPLDLAGPACESGDVLARDAMLPPLEPGDLVAVLEAGAYGASMASTYLTRPRPAEVLFENGEWTLLRRRDTLAEMLAAEVG